MSAFPTIALPSVAWREISTQELTVAADRITFDGIPAGFLALRVSCYLKADSSGANVALINLNDDTASNYERQAGEGAATILSAQRFTPQTFWVPINFGILANHSGMFTLMAGRPGASNNLIGNGTGAGSDSGVRGGPNGYRYFAAGEVTKIDIINQSAIWQPGSSATLEGLAAA